MVSPPRESPNLARYSRDHANRPSSVARPAAGAGARGPPEAAIPFPGSQARNPLAVRLRRSYERALPAVAGGAEGGRGQDGGRSA
uniref:Uncharacterized protein n=1 Tax=Oryza barthii TaxID=65489 RepID=A0A0D3H7H7_9ORYZ